MESVRNVGKDRQDSSQLKPKANRTAGPTSAIFSADRVVIIEPIFPLDTVCR